MSCKWHCRMKALTSFESQISDKPPPSSLKASFCGGRGGARGRGASVYRLDPSIPIARQEKSGFLPGSNKLPALKYTQESRVAASGNPVADAENPGSLLVSPYRETFVV